MRMRLAIAGLLVAGLPSAGVAMAAAMDDVSLVYQADSVAVSNSGTIGVAVTIVRACGVAESPPKVGPATTHQFRTVVRPADMVRIDRDPKGGCDYSIASARYFEGFGTLQTSTAQASVARHGPEVLSQLLRMSRRAIQPTRGGR